MSSPQDLSFAFLESHPAEAARVLERISPRSVAQLLADTPVRLGAPVLRSMLPLHAARCMDLLGDDAAVGLLRGMGAQSGVAILHYVPEMRRNALVAQLPTTLAVAFRLLLGYPEDTVGAWMNPQITALPGDTPVEAALEHIRDSVDERISGLFVVGSSQNLIGEVDLRDLMRTSGDVPVSRIARKSRYTLPARAPIHSVELHSGWDEAHMLPVIDRAEHFVGVLDRRVLMRALERSVISRNEVSYGMLLGDAAGGYWQGVSSLIQLAVAQIPVSAPESNRKEQ